MTPKFSSTLFKLAIEYPSLILSMLQRLPLLLFYGFWGIICYPIYRLTNQNAVMIVYFKICVRLFWLLNGIWISNTDVFKKWGPSVIIVNYKSQMDYIILATLLPTKRVGILPDFYFKDLPETAKELSIYQRAILSLGFFPAEPFTVFTYTQETFQIDPFLEAKFYLSECVELKNHHNQKIPYALMLAIKHQIPVHIIDFKNSEKAILASFFAPRLIKITHIESIAPSDNIQQMINSFHQCIPN